MDEKDEWQGPGIYKLEPVKAPKKYLELNNNSVTISEGNNETQKWQIAYAGKEAAEGTNDKYNTCFLLINAHSGYYLTHGKDSVEGKPSLKIDGETKWILGNPLVTAEGDSGRQVQDRYIFYYIHGKGKHILALNGNAVEIRPYDDTKDPGFESQWRIIKPPAK